MTEGNNGHHAEEEVVAGPSSDNSIDTTDGNLSVSQSSHASNHHMLTNLGSTAPPNAPPSNFTPVNVGIPNRPARKTRDPIDIARAPSRQISAEKSLARHRAE